MPLDTTASATDSVPLMIRSLLPEGTVAIISAPESAGIATIVIEIEPLDRKTAYCVPGRAAMLQ